MRNQLQEARWFIKSLESRNETLTRVANSIVRHQRAFFEYGEEAMRPLVLRDIAEELEMQPGQAGQDGGTADGAEPSRPVLMSSVHDWFSQFGLKMTRVRCRSFRRCAKAGFRLRLRGDSVGVFVSIMGRSDSA